MNYKNSIFNLSFLFLFSLIVLPSVMSAGLLDGLGAHWAFDENTGNITVDENSSLTAFGYESVVSDNVPILWNSNGFFGSSLSFDETAQNVFLPPVANDLLTVCDSAGEDCLNATWSFWIKPNSYTTSLIHQGDGSTFRNSFSYQNGFINVLRVSTGGAYCVGNTDNPILVGEWSHVVILNKDDSLNNTEIWINGQESNIAQTFTGNNFALCHGFDAGFQDIEWGGASSGGSGTVESMFNGSIDEFSFWRNTVLTDNQIASLFNGGNGLSYNSYSQQIPTLLQSLPDFDMSNNDQEILFLNNYFQNYDTISLSFVDNVNSENVVLSVDNSNISEDVYNTDDIYVSLTSLGDLFDNDVRLLVRSNVTTYDFDMVVVAENSLGNVFDTISVSIAGQQSGAETGNPSQIASMLSPITIPYNTIYDWDISDYFSDYDGARLNFNDNIIGVSVQIQTEKEQTYDSYANTAYNISLIPSSETIILRVITNTTQTDIASTLSVFYEVTNNTFNTISVPLTMRIRQIASVPTEPPQQIASIGTIFVDEGKTHTFRFNDFMVDYTGSSISFEDTLNGVSVNVIDGQTYEQGNFTVQIVGQQVKITGVNSPFEQNMFIVGTNQAGTLTIPFTLVVGTPDIGQDVTSGSGLFRSIVSSFMGLFPESQELSLGQRLGFVLITFLISAILIIIAVASTDTDSAGTVLKFVLPIVLGTEFMFFVGIGFIPITFVIILIVIAIAIVYLYFSRGT